MIPIGLLLTRLKAFWNPSVALALLLTMGAAGAAGYWRGATNTENRLEAERLRNEQIAETAYDAAILAAADAISGIKIVNTTIRQELEREIRTEPVYVNCRHSPDAKRLLDAVLSGEAPAESVSGNIVSPADPATE
jgi:hypothetical protein